MPPRLRLGLELVELAGNGRKDEEGVGGKGRDQHGKCGALEDLRRLGAAESADSEPDGPHPIGNTRPLAQECEDAAEIVRQRIGHVKKAEIGAFGQRLQPIEAGFGEGGPGAVGGKGGAEAWSGAAHPPPPAAALLPISLST